jgi:hypothetical protein
MAFQARTDDIRFIWFSTLLPSNWMIKRFCVIYSTPRKSEAWIYAKKHWISVFYWGKLMPRISGWISELSEKDLQTFMMCNFSIGKFRWTDAIRNILMTSVGTYLLSHCSPQRGRTSSVVMDSRNLIPLSFLVPQWEHDRRHQNTDINFANIDRKISF